MLKIDNINSEQVNEFNVLGLITDINVNWERLTQQFFQRMFENICTLNKLKLYFVLSQQIITAYFLFYFFSYLLGRIICV